MKKTKTTIPKISYEPEADVLTWELSGQKIHSAQEMGNVVVHFTKNDQPVLVEILEASRFLSKAKRLVEKKSPVTRQRALARA